VIPDCSNPELLKIVEMLGDAAKISAVPAAGFGEFGDVVGTVVGGISVGEAVDHDEVHDVFGGEAGKAVGGVAAG
jgi:hypothetical protein